MKTVKKIIVVLLLSLVIFSICSEDSKAIPPIGAGIFSQISGNGLAINPLTLLSLKVYKNVYSVGVLINSKGISGETFIYQRILSENNTTLKVYFLVSATYHHGGKLNSELNSVLKESQSDFSGISLTAPYKVVEEYIGFGVAKNLFSTLEVDLSTGVGSYFTLNKKELGAREDNFLALRSDNDLSLMLRLGLTYQF